MVHEKPRIYGLCGHFVPLYHFFLLTLYRKKIIYIKSFILVKIFDKMEKEKKKKKKKKKMKTDRYKISIGDTMYEASKSYSRVIEHKIIDIYFEQYISGYKTIVVTDSYLGRNSRFVSDIFNWYSTAEEAEEALNIK